MVNEQNRQESGRTGRPPLPEWTLTVTASAPAPGRMQRVTFRVEGDAPFGYRPGQALVMMIPLGNGETGRRDYTIRSHDPAAGTVAVDFHLHGSAPGPDWAVKARPGDTLKARGPRGGAVLRAEADWHLLTGDETCIPAIAHILETAPAQADIVALIEVEDADGEIEMARPVRWLHRNGPPAPGSLMADAVAAFPLPVGRGHACLIGETSNVRAQRRILIERGFGRDQLSCEGYWRPGRIGGHDHVED